MDKKLQYLALAVVLLLSMSSDLFGQARTVTGIVTSADDGNPLPGVTVLIPGTTIGTSTNVEGAYQIRVPDYNVELQFSFVGYRVNRVRVGDRSVVNVVLVVDTQNLDEVIVVGYGTLSRRQVTGSITQITSEDFAGASLTTVDQALQGRVAGVQFTSTSGLIGAPSSIRIRGAASISASTTPLIIIDGIPITNPTTAGSAAVGATAGGQGINPLLNLDPNDIESFEVLKDASATAIYGSQGSNGVILITTKQGRAGQQQININTYSGFVNETNNYDMMDGFEFTRIFNDAVINRFGAPNQFSLPTDNIVSTDWSDLVSQTGMLQETNVSLMGGTDRTRYRISGTYRWEEGYVRNNELNRYTARLRIDHAISDKLRVGLNLAPSRTDNFRVYTSNAVAAPFTYAALAYPNVPARNEDGSLNLGIAPNPFSVFSGTPLSNVEGVDFKSSLSQVLATADVQWNVLRNLFFNTEFSVDMFQLAENFKRSSTSTDGFPNGDAFASNNQYLNFTWNTTLSYQGSYENHTYNILGGAAVQRSENTQFSVSARGFPTDALKTINSAADPTAASGSGTSFANVGYFTRLNYSFMDRYIVNLSARLDGSSRFGSENRYGFFPSASVGWITSDEDWFDVGVLDFFKLRGSVGQTGNSNIGNFASLGLVGFGSDYNGIPGGAITQLANPELRWEKTTQFDGAVEFGLFNSRLRGTIGYYVKDTDDLLLNVPISRVNGFTSFTQNVGEIRNQGWEFELAADVIAGDFSWTTSANLSTVKNEVRKLVDGEDQIFGRSLVREGEPLGAWFLVRYNGVNPENGNATWLDLDGNVTESYSLVNRVITGSPFPDFFGGFTNTFGFRGVDLRVFFQYSYGNMIYRGDGAFTDSNLNSLFNQASRMNDYWMPDNTDASIPQPRLLRNNGNQASTRYLEDGSYLRLKLLTLGYTLPTEITRGVRARVYAQGENLLTFTKFKGMDPEAATAGNIQASDVFFQLPQARTITFGVNLTF